MSERFGGSFVDGASGAISNATAIYEPDMSAVVGQPSKYWVVTGDLVSLMSLAEQTAVDDVEIEARKDAVADQFDAIETVIRAFGEVVLDEFNGHADKINAILDAIDGASSLADVKGAVAAIPDSPQRTLPQLKTSVRGKL